MQRGLINCVAMIATVIAIHSGCANHEKTLDRACSRAETIRGAMAGYAADFDGNRFPPEIPNWRELARICNENGAGLPESEQATGLHFVRYQSLPGEFSRYPGERYILVLSVNDLPDDHPKKVVIVRPDAVSFHTQNILG